jgi:hypothetical protein
MTDKIELAKKINDLYNSMPRFPTLEEVAAILPNLNKEKSAWGSDRLETDLQWLMSEHGIINLLDALCVVNATVFDNSHRATVQGIADTMWQEVINRKMPHGGRYKDNIPSNVPKVTTIIVKPSSSVVTP